MRRIGVLFCAFALSLVAVDAAAVPAPAALGGLAGRLSRSLGVSVQTIRQPQRAPVAAEGRGLSSFFGGGAIFEVALQLPPTPPDMGGRAETLLTRRAPTPVIAPPPTPEPPQVEPPPHVPLPASGWLCLAGLALLFARRKRRETS